MVPPSRPADAEPLPADLSQATPEQLLTHALACFQAEVSPIAAADLAEVVLVAGAELCSESWADDQKA